MKAISINSRKFLGGYIDMTSREWLPDGMLCSGLLLTATLITILCLAGGATTLLVLGCVIVFGSALGVIRKIYVPYTILSCINGTVALTPFSQQPIPKVA